ncbi:MAG: VOC family protein [Acidobacteria bacterium]|nr:VOC family protein [Acidobacteriota bacterium]
MRRLMIAGALCAVVAGAPRAQAPAGVVIGVGNFIHVVADLERALTFYRDALGMEAQGNARAGVATRPFLDTWEILRLYDSVGAQYRVGATLVPGSPMRAEFIEVTAPDRRAIRPRIQDPGAATLVLTVRDLEATLARVQAAGGAVVTTGARPVALADAQRRGRAVLVSDPDGFYVQLVQRDAALPASAPAGNVVDVGFAATVADLDRTLALFRDTLGFDPQLDPSENDPARLALYGLPEARYRRVTALVPGTTFPVEFTELGNVPRRRFQSRPRDPGSSILRLRVGDLDQALGALDEAGVRIVSADGEPVEVVGANATQHFAITVTPDNLFVQVVQQVPAAAPAR